MNNEKWFSPENLRKQELLNESQFEQLGDCETSSDFRSYINLNKKNSSNDIHSHNLKEIDAIYVARIIEKTVNGKCSTKTILELGCGAGFSSKGLQTIFKDSRIKAIDASVNAIEYAKKTFPLIDFEVCGVDERTTIADAPFDLIVAYEFYPFSRTNDWEYQQGIIKQLLKNGSYLYIANVLQDSSIYKNLGQIQNDSGLKVVFQGVFPRSKVYRIIPSIVLASFFTKIFCSVFKKKYVHSILLSSNNG